MLGVELQRPAVLTDGRFRLAGVAEGFAELLLGGGHYRVGLRIQTKDSECLRYLPSGRVAVAVGRLSNSVTSGRSYRRIAGAENQGCAPNWLRGTRSPRVTYHSKPLSTDDR